MPEPLSADRTAESLLWYFEEPRRYKAEGRRRDALLLDSAVVLKLALGRRVDFAEPALNEARTLAVLRNAAAMYVRFLFFRPEATPYQILGLAPGASPEAIKESFRLLMHLVHPDRQDARVVWPDSFAALANRAYGILRNQDSRVQFDREAAARAAMARAIHRAAESHAASRMPVPLRPRPRPGRRGVLGRAKLPEWLTAGVGGFVREHPSVTAFTALIAVALLSVGVMVRERQDEALVRDVDEALEHTSAASLAVLPKLSWFGATATGAPAASPSSGATAKRSLPVDAKAPVVGVRSVAPDPASSPASGVGAPAAEVIGSAPVPPPATVATGRDASASLVSDPQAEGRASGTRAPAAEAGAPAAMPVVAKADSVPLPVRQAANAEPAQPPAPTAASSGTVVALPVVATAVPVPAPPAAAAMTTARVEPGATAVVPAGAPAPPATTEIESLFATFVESYESGRVDAFVDLFDVDAEANLRQGRTAIRGEYDELFRLSQWRKMQLTRVNWKRVGNRAVAKGEITVRIGWRDGREVEQRLAMDMELVRREGRVVIARMSQQPKN